MTAHLILFLPLVSVVFSSKPPRNVTRLEGRRLQLNCSYDQGYDINVKYLSKDGEDIIRTGYHDTPVMVGRFLLHDDTVAGQFTATIDPLRAEDTGMYRLCVDVPLGRDVFCEYLLEVQHAQVTTPGMDYSADGLQHVFSSGGTTLNSTTPSTQNLAEEEKKHPFVHSWFSLPILVCVCALLIVGVFGLMLLLKQQCDAEDTAPITLTYRGSTSQTDDYETMNAVRVNRLPSLWSSRNHPTAVHDPHAYARGDTPLASQSFATATSASQSCGPLGGDTVSMGQSSAPMPVYAEVQRRSNIYQNLRRDTQHDDIYHSLEDFSTMDT